VEVEYGKKWLVYPYFDRFGRLRTLNAGQLGLRKILPEEQGEIPYSLMKKP